MEHIVFERPREKLQAKGVGYLSTIEVLQLIIGSGTSNVSSARLAKRVMSLLMNGQYTLESLVAIDGIGIAKACQIIAALELGGRIKGIKSQLEENRAEDDFMQEIPKAISKLRKSTLLICMYDGAQRQLHKTNYELTPIQYIVRKICADALIANARYISIAIGSKERSLLLTTDELSLIKQLKSSLGLLDVQMLRIYVANQERVETWKI